MQSIIQKYLLKNVSIKLDSYCKKICRENSKCLSVLTCNNKTNKKRSFEHNIIKSRQPKTIIILQI